MDSASDKNDDDNISWDTDDDVVTNPSNLLSVSRPGPSRSHWSSESEEKKDHYWVSDKEEESEHTSNMVHDKEEESEHTSNMVHNWEAIGGSTREASEAGPSRPSLISHFVRMGYSEEMIMRAVKANGEEDENAILDTLLAYGAIEGSPPKHEDSPSRSIVSETEADNEDFSDDDFGCEEFTEDLSDKNETVSTLVGMDFLAEENLQQSVDVEFTEDLSDKDGTVSTLVDMGFLAEEASAAIGRCGLNASILELADSINAAQMAEEFDVQQWYPSSSSAEDQSYAYRSYEEKKRKGSSMETYTKRSRISKEKKVIMKKVPRGLDGDVRSFSIPNPMVGFGLPYERPRITARKLPESALGPPYFYYENVALTPKGVWETISRFLHDIEPEFVDSKFFSAAARKRGYIHNLPIDNRTPLLPIPPKTIFEAFPTSKSHWPSWDRRTQLNCLQTCIASAQLTERIRRALADSGDPPPLQVQDFILTQCRKWNLIWVGRHKVAALEPDEIETLLGFPRNHTRGGGIGRTERYKSLGNSFQIDTVAYHLSVLKGRYPNGMNVLSLFSGIGGAEVALHRLGIRLNTVVSVELSELNRNIVRSWWEQTSQTGNLIDFADVQELSGDRLEHLMKTYGRFDLVIGGSPCNNLAGSNRHTRDGLDGKHSSLFFDYFRILEHVKCIMGNSL